MENTLCTISIAFAVYGFIQIVFLFKIWEMLNNIRYMREDCLQQNAEISERAQITAMQERNEFYVRIAAGDTENAKNILYREIAKSKALQHMLKAKNDSTFKKSTLRIEHEFKQELKMVGVHLDFKIFKPQ